MKNLELDKYINDEQLNKLADFLLNLNLPIFINGHINTDYDSICSGLTLSYVLNQVGKNAKMIFSKDAEILYNRVKDNDFDEFIINKFEKPLCSKYVGILVDMNSTYRASQEQMFLDASVKINIDHHDNNNMICDIKYVDENAGANSENILKLCFIIEKKTGKKILNKYMAKLLCMGIITDTSNIVKSTNLAQTRWAINIIESFGISAKEIADTVYNNLNAEQLKILDESLKSKQTFGIISYYSIDETKIPESDIIHNDYCKVLSEIVDRDSNPVVLYEQIKSYSSVWEFRSSDIENYPVNEIALYFGGGGHKNASGATIKDKSAKEVVEAFNKVFNKK